MDANPEPTTTTIDHATCLACGCLCDDITLTVEGGRIVEAARACPIGRPWFLAPAPGESSPSATIEGEPCDLDRALDRASEILRAARGPVLWGLAWASIEAQRVAVAIADRLGAAVDLDGAHPALLRGFQRSGQVSSTLGEVKDRADLVVYWGVDPASTHPRLGERHALEPRSRFLPRGRLDRTLIVVDHRPTPSAALADLHLAIPPDRRVQALWTLRALAQEVPLAAEPAAEVPFESLENLAQALARARFGALFFDPSARDSFEAEGILTLVRDLNQGRRFVALPLGPGGNQSGAEATLAWQTGFPAAVDFALGYPRHLPVDATLAARLEAGSVDAALIVAGDPPDRLSAQLRTIPTITIAPGATRPGPPSTVAIDVARLGIEEGGTVARSDGVMLPLRPALAPLLPTARAVLEALRLRLVAAG